MQAELTKLHENGKPISRVMFSSLNQLLHNSPMYRQAGTSFLVPDLIELFKVPWQLLENKDNDVVLLNCLGKGKESPAIFQFTKALKNSDCVIISTAKVTIQRFGNLT